MPRFNFYLILFAILVYALTADVTLRDRLLISTLHCIEHDAYVEPSAKELFEGAMSGMTEVLSEGHGDGYTMYVPPSKQGRYQDNLINRSEGLGISTKTYEEGEEQKLVIDFPFLDSPAYRSGLRSGDQILLIDGVRVADKTNIEIRRLLRQSNGANTCLSILPFGQTEPKDFFVHREKFHYDSVVGDYLDSDSPIFRLEAHPKIGYIGITSFSESTAEEFGNALEQMVHNRLESFVLDLRENPGGDVWNCIQIARMLLSSASEHNVIVTIHPRNGRERDRVLNEGVPRCTLPMVVLINGDSASSSEILAAALQDHKRATVVGTRSFGKGVIQSIFELPFQSGMMQLTDAEYRRPNGAIIHRKKNAAESEDWGVIPDKIVELTKAECWAVAQYRTLRSHVVSTERSAVLAYFRQQIITQQNDENKQENSVQEPFEFTGVAPYYDLQLDEAIKILLTMGTSDH